MTIERLRCQVRPPHLERDGLVASPPGDLQNMAQKTRTMALASRLRVGRDVQNVQLVSHQPIVSESHGEAGDGIVQDLDARPGTRHFLLESLTQPRGAKRQALDLHDRVQISRGERLDEAGLRSLVDGHGSTPDCR